MTSMLNEFHLECSDEDNVQVYFNMKRTGRFSLIATSIDQYENHPDTFLFSTQTPNICRLIKRLTKSTITECIRLVRGPVPENFHCQYLQFVRQHTHDILVGLTQEGLVVEWNLESEASCRYATNLNEILTKLSESYEEQMLETYIDQARTNYRENFQFNMQLISTHDWAAFFQFWKWTGQYTDEKNDETDIPYQSRQRFHLVASLQDLADHGEALISSTNSIDSTSSSQKHRSLLTQMSNFVLAPHSTSKNRHTFKSHRTISLLTPQGEKPFDQSVYDSNQFGCFHRENLPKKNARRTQ